MTAILVAILLLLSSPTVVNVTTSEGPSGLTTSTPATISGTATWYDAPTSRDAAAGPALRRALGSGWRDSTVEVCASHCIEVVLSDWCQCPNGHVIDLDDVAFSGLAPLSQGVLRVRVLLQPQPRPIAPATDYVP